MSADVQHVIYEFFIFYIPFLGLTIFYKFFHLFLAHCDAVRAQIVSHLAHWNESIALRIENSKRLHQFLFHCHFMLFVHLNKRKCTIKARKSAKSIFDEMRGVSDLMARSPKL